MEIKSVQRQFKILGWLILFSIIVAFIFNLITQSMLTGSEPTLFKQIVYNLFHFPYKSFGFWTSLLWSTAFVASFYLILNNIYASTISLVIVLFGLVKTLTFRATGASHFVVTTTTRSVYTGMFNDFLSFTTTWAGLFLGFGIVFGLLWWLTNLLFHNKISQSKNFSWIITPIFDYRSAVTRATFGLVALLIVIYPFFDIIVSQVNALIKILAN